MNGARLGFGVNVTVRQSLQIPVKQDPDNFTFLVHGWTARVSPMGVISGDEVERRAQFQSGPGLDPARRKVERLFAGGALVKACERGIPRNRLAGRIGVSFHGSVAHPKSKRRIRILTGSVHCKPSLRKLRRTRGDDRFDLVFVLRPYLASRAV